MKTTGFRPARFVRYQNKRKICFEISNLTLEQLAFLRGQIDALLEIRYAEKVVNARRRILSIASGVGVPVAAILDERAIPDKPAPHPVQHPEHPDLIWAGRGRRPKWMKEYLDAGKSIDDLRLA